jgi:zinc protease
MKRLFALILIVFAVPAQAEVDIQEVVSPGGIKAWLVEDHSIPFMALELRFRGGASLDAPGKRGAINLMTGLLEEGTGDLDSRGFARAVEEVAASFDYDVSADALSVSARFLTEYRDESIALLRGSVLSPNFEQADIDRVRDQVITSLRSDATDPNTIAGDAWNAMAFGDHPYGSNRDGTIESVSALTRDDIVAAHKATIARDRLYVGAVGDITPEELGALLDTLFDGLQAEGAAMPPQADLNIEGGLRVVDFDTPQSVAIFGHAGIDQDDPDFFAARILMQVLGAGGFESRLTTEVREKRGLTYGVYSYLASRDLAATVRGQVASSNDRVAEAIEVIRAEWARAAEGISEEEMEAAKLYMTGAYPLNFSGNGQIARIMVGMQMLGLPIDYIPTRNDKVEAVTLDDIKRVAGELLKPEDLMFVVVGKPEGLESTLAN